VKPTRALSIRPQWIEAILRLGKRWENRDWPEGYPGLAVARRLVGQTIYLHAGLGSASKYAAGASWIEGQGLGTIRPWNETVKGALVATATLEAVAEDGDPRADAWAESGYIGLILSDVRPLAKPIPLPGKLGFFFVELPANTRIKLGDVIAPPSPRARGKRGAAPSAMRPAKGAAKASAAAKARKASTPAPKKAATDWQEAGRKAYKTRLKNAAARGDRDAARKLVALS
jgi:hypothetical protein